MSREPKEIFSRIIDSRNFRFLLAMRRWENIFAQFPRKLLYRVFSFCSSYFPRHQWRDPRNVFEIISFPLSVKSLSYGLRVKNTFTSLIKLEQQDFNQSILSFFLKSLNCNHQNLLQWCLQLPRNLNFIHLFLKHVH